MEFSASYDRTTKIISTVVCLGLLAVVVAVHNIILTSLSLLTVVVSYAYSPRGYLIQGRSLVVKRLASNAVIKLDDIREARRATLDDFRGCIRLWGSGGLFGYYGLFSTAKLGKSTWYVTNRENGVVMIAGAKPLLVSPDDPDGFLRAIRTAAPMLESNSGSVFDAGRRYGSLGKMIGAGLAIAAMAVAVFATTYSPGAPSYTLTREGLTIHDRFYPVTLRASGVDLDKIRVVDLAHDALWRPTSRTNGFANTHYRAGWFRVASGQTVRLYRADGERVVLLPPKGDGAAVLYEAANPEALVNEIRAAWSAPAQGNANAAK